MPIASLFEPAPNGRLHVSRKSDYPVVSFEGSSERWHVLGAGLFQGKIRSVVSTLGAKERGVKTDKVIIEPGQMKLFYVIEGKVALHYNGDVHRLDAGDSAYLDGGTPHGWENVGGKAAKALWVILGIVGGGLDGPLRASPELRIAPAEPALERGTISRWTA